MRQYERTTIISEAEAGYVQNKTIVKTEKEGIISRKYLESLYPNVEISNKDLDEINEVLEGHTTEEYNNFLSSFVEYKELIREKEFNSFKSFMIAIKYITYIANGNSIMDAYCKSHTHNATVRNYMLTKSVEEREEIANKAAKYARTKGVLKLTQAMDYPLHLLFQGYRYQAVEQLRKEMKSANKAQDRIMAADKLLTHLDPMKNQTMVNVSLSDKTTKSLIDSYKEALEMFAEGKKDLVQKGAKLEEVINIEVIKEEEEEDGRD